MNNCVRVSKVNQDGCIIVRPLGTFLGFGGIVSINPYRELAADVSPLGLGKTVKELLELSGPTSYHIKDIAKYNNETDSVVASSLRERYFRKVKSAKSMAIAMTSVEVSIRKGGKSWRLERYDYDAGSDNHIVISTLRIAVAQGSAALGKNVLEML
ncbi:hypothetical protein BH11PLA2_BH11PLA2_14790 [soil metagenome]